MFAYAANNPLRYIDPDGRENSLVAKYRNELIKGINNLKKNIKILNDICSYDIHDIPLDLKNIVKEDLGYNLDNSKQLQDFKIAVFKLKCAIERLDISNFRDGSTDKVYAAFVDQDDFSHKIYITSFFGFIFKGLTVDTTESCIFHEMTHFNDTLGTIDNYELNRYQLKKMPDNEKRKTAQSWQLFYEDFF